MDEGVYMTKQEINRLQIFNKIKDKRLSQTQAAKELNLSIRQIQRLYKSFKTGDIKALVSKKRGMPGNRQLKPSIRRQVIDLITCEMYLGFGPKFMSETIEKKHRLKISKETTRRLMILHQVWAEKKKKIPTLHQQRQRRARFGELTQIDGSPHSWFEDRGDRCTLIVFIDDATGRLYCKFVESETTHAYMQPAWEYINKYGIPLAFYSDKHAIFRINMPNCNPRDQLTQFGRALKELDIRLLCANSPQAKGRVERANKTLQDRLVKELRINGINTIEQANKFLRETYIEEFNQQFSVLPSSQDNAHRKTEENMDLSHIFCEKNTRKVSKNLELQFENTIYQIKLQKPFHGLINARVTVLKKLDGTLLVKYKDKILPVVEYFKQPYNGQIVNSKEIDQFLGDKKKDSISPHHPWNQQGRAEAKRRVFYAA